MGYANRVGEVEKQILYSVQDDKSNLRKKAEARREAGLLGCNLRTQ